MLLAVSDNNTGRRLILSEALPSCIDTSLSNPSTANLRNVIR